jgi:hypothetical protein
MGFKVVRQPRIDNAKMDAAVILLTLAESVIIT